MVQSNKILTVSYGTFSCTLEGFEDSFGTMTAIAEYFRDLAADDRYFGAEPPQPDAELLAKIAQKEIARQVEGRREGTGIVLRATDGPQDTLPAPAPAVAEASAPSLPETVELEDVVPAEEQTATPHLEEQIAPEEPLEINDFEEESEDAAPFFEAEIEPAESAAETPAADSIAAKLQRIRAVVSRNDASTDHDYSEDEHAEPLDSDNVLDDASSEPADLIASDGDVEALLDRLDVDTSDTKTDEPETPLFDDIAQNTDTPRDEVDVENEPDELSNILAEPNDDEPKTKVENTQEQASAATPKRPQLRARVIKVKRADLDDALATGELQDVSERADSSTEVGLSDDDEAELLRELAEVEAELNAPEPEQDNAETESPSLEDTIAAMMGDSALEDGSKDDAIVSEGNQSEENEDDFEAELTAALEAEEPAQEEQSAAEFEDGESFEAKLTGELEAEEDKAEDQAAAANVLSQTPEVNDDVSRLMAETDSKMDASDSSSKHAEIAHLRAAVAAAEADTSLSDAASGKGQDEAYRNDLDSVVRPRRPAAKTRKARRPEEKRPAPLKLVAEQRVDDPSARKPSGPVRPRRIGVATEQEPERAAGSEGGFADFAAAQGATDLLDLLEAAAAYLSFVEGRDQFSRPQLMTKVRMVEQEEFSREDGLRSFGQLLRDGKIEKIRGGRFTVSDRIGFKPSDRAAS